MRTSTTFTAIGLALTSFASAQDSNRTGPFYLHVKGSGNDLDGYISACHTGAALEGLCYNADVPKANLTDAYEFYFNYTSYAQTYQNSTVGVLSWHLPVQISPEQPFVESQMVLQYVPTSNIGTPSLGPGDTPGTQVGFDINNANELFAWSPIEDSQNKPGADGRPEPGSYAVFNWFVCWQQLNSYYYQSVGLANSLPPTNPTCEAVEIHQEFPGSS